MSMTLYHHPVSTCSQKVRLALAEKQCAWESRVVDLHVQEQLSEAYLALNPNGVVPTLVHNGRPITDSSVICEYLEETQPGLSLAPADPVGRAAMRAWMRYFEEVPTVAIRAPSFNLVFFRHDPDLARTMSQARPGGHPVRKHFYEAAVDGQFSQAVMDQSLNRLRSALERVERALADGRAYLLGEISIADIVLLPTVVRMQDLGLAGTWIDLPKVGSWLARMESRPSFAAAYYDGTRLHRPDASA